MGWELLAAARNTNPAQARDTLQSSQLMGWELLAAARNTKTSSAWPNLCFHTTSPYADVWASQMLASHWNYKHTTPQWVSAKTNNSLLACSEQAEGT